MNLHLSIYQPQGVSIIQLMTFEEPLVRHTSRPDRSEAQRKHDATLNEASSRKQIAEAHKRYVSAFGGESRTATYLSEVMGITRSGALLQLRKYIKAGHARVCGVRDNERLFKLTPPSPDF